MRRMITGKLIEWIKSLKDKIHQNGNTTEIGGNVEVDGDLQVNSSILDSEGDEAIDIGTSDISIHKNVNVGSIDEPEDLFVSGKITQKPQNIEYINVQESWYDENEAVYIIPQDEIPMNTPFALNTSSLSHSDSVVRISSSHKKILIFTNDIWDSIDSYLSTYGSGFDRDGDFVIELLLDWVFSIYITNNLMIIGRGTEEF